MPAGGSLLPAPPETVAQRMHYVHQDGRPVYKYAVRKMVETSSKSAEAQPTLPLADLGCFIPHQANKRIILSTAERLGLPSGARGYQYRSLRKHHRSDDSAGHAHGGRNGQLKRGENVLLAAFGGGFTVGACLLRWEM